MKCKTTEESDTINDLLKVLKKGLPWDKNKSKLYYINPQAHIAVIIGPVEIKRTAVDTWEIKSRAEPRRDQWEMSHAWVEHTERGRNVNRLMLDTVLYQQVHPDVMYVQYPNNDLKPANRLMKGKGKMLEDEIHSVGATVWFSQGTANFMKMICDDGSTFLRIVVDMELHDWITTWNEHAYVKWFKVTEETETGKIRASLQAIGNAEGGVKNCRTEIREISNEAVESTDGDTKLATTPKRSANEVDDDNEKHKMFKATKEEPGENATGQKMLCPGCGSPWDPKVAKNDIRNKAQTPVDEAATSKSEEQMATNRETVPHECNDCGNPFSCNEILRLHQCERAMNETPDGSPAGSVISRNLFPVVPETPAAKTIPKFKFKP